MISERYSFSCPADRKMAYPFSLLSKILELLYCGAERTQGLINLGTVPHFSTGYFHFLKQFYKVDIIPVSEIKKRKGKGIL